MSQTVAQMWRERIIAERRIIDKANERINEYAAKVIPEFHFLNHQVSTFWECDKSPIGVCVWDISEKGFHIDCTCYYCGDPVERK